MSQKSALYRDGSLKIAVSGDVVAVAVLLQCQWLYAVVVALLLQWWLRCCCCWCGGCVVVAVGTVLLLQW
jgi:hypothetical protein